MVDDLFKGPLAIGQRLATYELLEKLGEGGMGTVWKARHLKLDKLVALKVLPQHLTNDPATVSRFEREMRAVGRVEHANVVRAMDANEVGGRHFLVMEYVEGIDLSKYVKQRGPRSVSDACVMIRHAALGLAAAHAKGLIHRDIKPSNLLLSKQGQVKVLDLGLARLLDEGQETRQVTQTGQILGTPDYMAPEQWDNTHSVDHRADLYALGCTLCFLLTGRAPYGDASHTTTVQKMKAHLMNAPPRLRDLRPDVPEELDALYSQLMVKDAAQRSISAAELAERLKDIVGRLSVKGSAARVLDMGSAPAACPGSATEADDAAASSTIGKFKPSDKTVSSNSPETTQFSLRVPPRTSASVRPSRWHSPRWIMAAAGGVVTLVLVGVMLNATTTRKGTRTTIQTRDGASDADPNKDLKPIVKANGATKKTTASPMTTRTPASQSNNNPPLAVVPFDATKARAHQEAWAKHLEVPVEFTNSIGITFRLIPPGEFTMGLTQDEAEAAARMVPNDDRWRSWMLSSAPKHRVRITQAFYLSVCEVTQNQYERITGINPSFFSARGKGRDKVVGFETKQHPVENVSFIDVAEYCIKLSRQERLKPHYFSANGVITMIAGDGYRLPTEAEWEYACRAGSNTAWFTGDQESTLGTVGWFNANSGGMTHETGQLAANPFGLCDTHGNVWEWCFDWHDPTAYAQRVVKQTVDPRGPPTGAARVLRSGDWLNRSAFCRSALRTAHVPTERMNLFGFRLAASLSVSRPNR